MKTGKTERFHCAISIEFRTDLKLTFLAATQAELD